MGTKEKPRGMLLILGMLFGIGFGFLLQKGGVGKFHILIGQLLLRDFTVMKVMLTAIAVGMTLAFILRARGKLELQVKPTRFGANIMGGLVFGAGFALAAYCPGTNMVALGQGNLDALAVAAGLIAGSYLFALSETRLKNTVMKWDDRGKITLPDLLPIKSVYFALAFASLLAGVLIILERVTSR